MGKSVKRTLLPKVTWDLRRLVTDAGGVEALCVAHANMGFHPLSASRIANWRSRNSIPSEQVAEILVTLQSLIGGGIDVFDYLKLGGGAKK